MRFLKNEVENEEKISMAIQGFSLGNNIKGMKLPEMESGNSNKIVPTTADLVNLIVDPAK
jgi:hypothetical protein